MQLKAFYDLFFLFRIFIPALSVLARSMLRARTYSSLSSSSRLSLLLLLQELRICRLASPIPPVRQTRPNQNISRTNNKQPSKDFPSGHEHGEEVLRARGFCFVNKGRGDVATET